MEHVSVNAIDNVTKPGNGPAVRFVNQNHQEDHVLALECYCPTLIYIHGLQDKDITTGHLVK